MAYNARFVSEPPESLRDLVKPEYKRRVVIRDEFADQVIIWGKAMGYEDPTKMSKEDLNEVIEFVVKVKRAADAPVLTLGPMLERLVSGEAWICSSAGWEGFPKLAAQHGAEVRLAHPKEGDHAWMDAWCIPKDAPNVDTAYAWIDWMIGSAAQHIVCRNLVCGTVNRKAVELLDAETKAIFPHDDLGNVFKNGADFDLPALKPTRGRATLDDWERAWERVRTA